MSISKKLCSCSCFYSRNYYIQRLLMHVTYYDKDQFIRDYGKDLRDNNITDEKDINAIIFQLETEFARRKSLEDESLKRIKVIKETYTPLFAHVYSLQESFLNSDFVAMVKYAKSSAASLDGLLHFMKISGPKIYSFPLFNKHFCGDLVAELQNFEASGIPKGRPNTMNNYGYLLYELGFEEGFSKPLRENYLAPLTRILFPEYGGTTLDSHRAFVVSYTIGKDVALDYHYDNSELTMNVCLSRDFRDGDLYFGTMRSEPDNAEKFTRCSHRLGYALLHRGQHLHGAMPIEDGSRYNMIMWMRSSTVRNQLCPMCDEKPKLIDAAPLCADGFTRETMSVCRVT